MIYKLSSVFVSLTFFVFSLCAQINGPITPETALDRYLKNDDASYKWELKDTYSIGDITVYGVLLTSQTWRGHVWKHQLSVAVPKEIKHDGALLFITGGSLNKEGMPNWSGKDDKFNQSIAMLSRQNSAITAVLKQIPNQPLYGDLKEDALISYTLHQFKNDGDYTWPLLFPMVKGAKRAMDAVQEIAKQKASTSVNRFVVSGASKRGWTSWLTGANDDRVVAFAPMVIDMLNMPVSMKYQITTWNEYSEQIQDYVNLGIVQEMATSKGNAITTMIDPYTYRNKMNKPKMIFMGTNDRYWPVDNIKNYIDDIPGKNFIHYIPNEGHGLGNGIEALMNLSSFFGLTMNNAPYPECSWKTKQTKKGIQLSVNATADKLIDVIVWTANSKDRDFRDDKWESKSLGIQQQSKIEFTKEFPDTGYRAFYLDLKYKDANGNPFFESTRIFLTDDKKLL